MITALRTIILSWCVCLCLPAVDEAVLMADYDGLNRESTIVERKAELAKVVGRTSLTIRVYSWPDKISVHDPTADHPASDLRDGDRGFVWQLSTDQLLKLIIARAKTRKTLTIEIKPGAKQDAEHIKIWADGLGFATVAYP